MKPIRVMGDCGAGCCLILDSSIGGSGPSANETTQNASGTGRIIGKGAQYTEGGAISVGKKGKYQESGSTDLSGLKIGKGGNLTINEGSVTGMGSSQPIASTGTTPATTPPDQSGGLGNSAPLAPSSSTTPATVPSGNWWDNIPGADQAVTFWSGLSTWQKVAAGTVAVLIAWLIFHKRGRT